MKKAKPARKEEDIVYVGIDDPIAVRRDILEASKSMVRVLKGQHSVNAIRMAKHKFIEELRGKVTELNRLMVEARHMLPHMEEASLPAPAAVPKAEKPRPAPQPKAIPAAHTRQAESHMDKFERELQDIEDKLKSL